MQLAVPRASTVPHVIVSRVKAPARLPSGERERDASSAQGGTRRSPCPPSISPSPRPAPRLSLYFRPAPRTNDEQPWWRGRPQTRRHHRRRPRPRRCHFQSQWCRRRRRRRQCPGCRRRCPCPVSRKNAARACPSPRRRCPRPRPVCRARRSSTFRLDVSTFCGIRWVFAGFQ